MRTFRFPFGLKLFLAMTGIVLSVSLSIYMIVARVFEDKMRETAHYQLEEQMSQTIQSADYFLDQLRSVYLNMTADAMLIQTFADGYNSGLNPRLQYPIRKMDTLSAVYHWVYSIYLYEPKASLFFNSNSLSTSELLDDTWLHYAMQDNGMYHFAVFEDRNHRHRANQLNLSVGGPIRKNLTEEVVAYFSILVSLDELQRRIFPPSYSEGTLYAMYDGEGKHLLGDLLDQKPDTLLPPASEVSYRNSSYLQFSQTSTAYGWTFMILTPSAEMYAGIHRIRGMTIPLVMISLLCALLLSLYLSWRFTWPITALTRAVRNFRSSENTTNTIEDLARTDEFQELNEGLVDMAGRINHLIVDVYQRELQKKEMELKMLYRSIDPHFVYNVLDSINWQVTLGKNKEAGRALIALSRYLRGTMFKQGQWTDLKKARDEIEAYNRLQSIFYTEKILCHIHFPEELMTCHIPSMVLQPIVENCYTHGYPEGYAGNPFISVSARLDHNALELTIVDNGVGIGADCMTELQEMLRCEQAENGWERDTRYFALRNVQSRIRIQCGAMWGMAVDSEGSGTTVTVRLPIHLNVPEEVDASCGT